MEPAVVASFVPDPQDNRGYSSGSSTVVHADGYALTNDHVVKGESGYAVLRGKPVRFDVVGRSPEKDLAVIKLRDHQGHLLVVLMGHSYDVMNGETVAVVGNPGGRETILTSGIISSKGTQATVPSALFASQNETKWRHDFIQYDAATNRGNSGGALINMDGQMIGVVAAMVPDEQSNNFAIPIDRVRKLLERIVEPELIHQRRVGIELNPQADSAIVTDVIPGSPADEAGVHVSDVLQSVDGNRLTSAADWWWTLNEILPSGKSISVVARRGDQTLKIDRDGLYRVNLTPDDGSRLHLHGEVFIDHDGNHPTMTLSRLTRFSAGLHPIEIEYFEGYGDNILDLKLQRLGGKRPASEQAATQLKAAPEFLHAAKSNEWSPGMDHRRRTSSVF